MNKIINFFTYSIYLDNNNLILRNNEKKHNPISEDEIINIYDSIFNGKIINHGLKAINLDIKIVLSYIIKSDLDGFVEFMTNSFNNNINNIDIIINMNDIDNLKSISHIENEISFKFFKYNEDILIYCCINVICLNAFILTKDGTIIQTYSK